MKKVFSRAQQECFKLLGANHKMLAEYSFVLIGGTALSLQVQHRISEDFDFISSKDLDLERLLADLRAAFGEIQIIQLADNTLEVSWRGVKLSFFGGIKFPFIKSPVKKNKLLVASIPDILAMKIATLFKRSTLRDYFDLAFALKYLKYEIQDFIKFFYAKYGKQGEQFREELIVKSLCFMEDMVQNTISISKYKSFWLNGDLKSNIGRVISGKAAIYIEAQKKKSSTK